MGIEARSEDYVEPTPEEETEEPVELAPEFCKVGIGITTLNGVARLSGLLQSIHEAVPEEKCAHVVIADDGSFEKNLILLRALVEEYNKLDNLKIAVLEHRQNLGIVAGWNNCKNYLLGQGLPYVGIFNDDVLIPEDWFTSVEFLLDTNGKIGVVGFHQRNDEKVILPDGMTEKDVYLRTASSGYCFVVRDECFLQVGDFDPSYFSFYEDLDFGVRVYSHGFVCVDAPPVVDHLWGETFRQNESALLPKIRMKSSEKIFRGKWGNPEAIAESLEKKIKNFDVSYLYNGKKHIMIPKRHFKHWNIG